MDLYINWFFVFIPLLGLLINIGLQISIYRLRNSIGLLKTIFIGFFLGFCAIIIGQFVLYYKFPMAISDNDFYALIIANFIIYSFLGYLYFSIIGLGETARRIRILTELFYESNGLTINELLSRYSAKDMIHKRLARLLRSKQIRFENNRYFTTGLDMFLLSKFAILMKIFLLGRPCENLKN